MIVQASAEINLNLRSILPAGGDHTDAQHNSPAWEKSQATMDSCHQPNSVNVMENLARHIRLQHVWSYESVY